MCVYNKKNMCIYVCVWGCLDKYISIATWPSQTKIPGSALDLEGLLGTKEVQEWKPSSCQTRFLCDIV